MIANALDLRFRVKEIIKALDRGESVSLKYRGKTKGLITPVSGGDRPSVKDLPIFGIRRKDPRTVDEIMDDLRGGRYRAL